MGLSFSLKIEVDVLTNNIVWFSKYQFEMNKISGQLRKWACQPHPPYLSMISNESNENFLNGVSFASGGTGIFDDTHDR